MTSKSSKFRMLQGHTGGKSEMDHKSFVQMGGRMVTELVTEVRKEGDKIAPVPGVWTLFPFCWETN